MTRKEESGILWRSYRIREATCIVRVGFTAVSEGVPANNLSPLINGLFFYLFQRLFWAI